MIGRTMSHLFLTVVAAAIFLVSGCVPPIDAPDSGEQVRAVEAERIEKLEQDVAKAVAAVEPGRMQQQKKEVIAEAVKAVGPALMNQLFMDRPKVPCSKKWSKECVVKALQDAIRREPGLQDAIRDILCVRPGTITLRDVGRFQEAINGDLMAKLREEPWTKPSNSSWNDTDPKKRTVYTLHYEDLTKAKYAAIRGKVDKWAKESKEVGGGGPEQVVLGRQDTFEPCEEFGKDVQVDYVAVPGVAGADADQNYSVSITLNVKDVLAVSSVFLVPAKDHWLYPYENNEKEWEKYPKEKPFDKLHEITKDTKVFSLDIEGDLKNDPRPLIDGGQKTVYVMIAREHEIPGSRYARPFQVVQYRKVEIGSPRGTFEDEQLPLERPTVQPACPPTTGIIPKEVQDKFKGFLKNNLKWEGVDKVTNLEWKGCKEKNYEE